MKRRCIDQFWNLWHKWSLPPTLINSSLSESEDTSAAAMRLYTFFFLSLSSRNHPQRGVVYFIWCIYFVLDVITVGAERWRPLDGQSAIAYQCASLSKTSSQPSIIAAAPKLSIKSCVANCGVSIEYCSRSTRWLTILRRLWSSTPSSTLLEEPRLNAKTAWKHF